MPRTLTRPAEPSDAPAIARLVEALETHYGGPSGASCAADTLAMVERSMTDQEGTRYALGFRDGEAVGLLCFAVLRPGFRLKGLIFLKELFVEESARGQAVGADMLLWLADHARSLGLGRIDLTTDRLNGRAQVFYERLGAQKLDKLVYRFTLGPEDASPDSGPACKETA
jgi:RimJ/RimL family protein N-acetyltransferase